MEFRGDEPMAFAGRDGGSSDRKSVRIAKQMVRLTCAPWLRCSPADLECKQPQHLFVFLQLQREFRTS